MPDYYHGPALALTALFLPAFGYLYHRYRDIRTLLWFLGFLFALVSMVLLYEGQWFPSLPAPWSMAMAQSAQQIGSALFLASLSPLKFRVGRAQVLYAIPYCVPLVICSIVYFGVCQGDAASGWVSLLFPLLGAVSLVTAAAWSGQKGTVPIPVSLAICLGAGGLCYWTYYTHGPVWALVLIQSSNLLVTTLLIAFVFARISPGVVLSALGLTAWSLHALEIVPMTGAHPALELHLIHVAVMGKVVAAVGMILLALEDELGINLIARLREQRERNELAAYTGLVLARRRVEDLDRLGDSICALVAEHSRFAKTALLLDKGGRYQVSGSAGFTAAAARALDAVAARMPVQVFPPADQLQPVVEHSQTYPLDLAPWLEPGDDLEQVRLGKILAVPLQGRTSTEGFLLLAGMRKIDGNQDCNRLRRDDLRPIETLAARLQATRSHVQLFEKLVDAERYAGVGQLAANVTQQLNNPLTVILGYASLLEGDASLDAQARKGIRAILAEARRMRTTLERLSRVSQPNRDQLAAVPVAELFADMEQLCRAEFLHHGIEFQTKTSPDLPRALCNAQQLRQAVLHCLQFCVAALENKDAPAHEEPKRIRMEATSEGRQIQIEIAHSGMGFLHPERAFDPFAPSLASQETAGLGLSLCATILRDNNGRASAINLEPQGAAILLELPVA